MCGIVAVVLHDKQQPAAELIYNALCMLQHRGQDAAGIVTSNNGFLNLRKQNGLVSEVFKVSTKLLKSNAGAAVIIVRTIFISAYLFYCLLLNHSFPTNPNSVY